MEVMVKVRVEVRVEVMVEARVEARVEATVRHGRTKDLRLKRRLEQFRSSAWKLKECAEDDFREGAIAYRIDEHLNEVWNGEEEAG